MKYISYTDKKISSVKLLNEFLRQGPATLNAGHQDNYSNPIPLI
jgi:hypothetical protein